VVRATSAKATDLSPVILAVVERLANDAVEWTRTHDGILTNLTVGVPGGAPIASYLDALEHELSARGLDFIDLKTEPCQGPARIVAMGFEPGWAA